MVPYGEQSFIELVLKQLCSLDWKTSCNSKTWEKEKETQIARERNFFTQTGLNKYQIAFSKIIEQASKAEKEEELGRKKS